MKYDVFISHASEDKPDVVRPLFEQLTAKGVKVWLDEQELTLGDSLRRNIDLGLSTSRFGLVVLSHAFFAKEWPKKELDGLVAREDGREKVILPVWHNLTVDDVKAYSLMLADRVGGTTSRGIDKLVDQILKALEIEARREQSLSPNFAKMEEAAAKVKQGASSLSENSDGGFKSIQELFTKSLDLVNEAFENYSGDVTGFRTGIHDLDSLILGLHKPEVTLIASRPLVGKTALALTIAHNVAIDEGLPVAYIATGYDELQFVNRMIGIDGFISTRNLENGSLTDDEWSRVVSVSVRFDDANLVFLEQSELNVKDVVDKATRLAEGFNGLLGLVVFDCNRYFDPRWPPQTAPLLASQTAPGRTG